MILVIVSGALGESATYRAALLFFENITLLAI